MLKILRADVWLRTRNSTSSPRAAYLLESEIFDCVSATFTCMSSAGWGVARAVDATPAAGGGRPPPRPPARRAPCCGDEGELPHLLLFVIFCVTYVETSVICF